MAPPTPLSIVSRTLADIPTRISGRQDSATITIISTTTTTSAQLSAGAIAGIVVGSVVGFILILLLIWWAVSSNQSQKGSPPPPRRRRRYHSHSPHTPTHTTRYVAGAGAGSSAAPHHSHSRSRSRSHSRHYRRSVEVVRQDMSEPQRVYVAEEPRYHSRGRSEWRG